MWCWAGFCLSCYRPAKSQVSDRVLNISGLLFFFFFSPSMCWQLSLHSFLRSQPKCVGAARFVMNELWSPWHSWNICTNRCCLSVFQSLSSFPHSCDFSPFTYSPVGFFTFTFKLQQSTFNLSLGNLPFCGSLFLLLEGNKMPSIT